MLPRDARSHRRPAGWTDLPVLGTAPNWSRPQQVPEVVREAGKDAVAEFWLLWSSPMASQWDPAADLAVTVRVVLLRTAIARGDEAGAKRMAELRALEDRLGLSALARERLRWHLPTAAPTEDDASVISLSSYLEN
ncbi:hypothetical protein Krad_4700 (plasmid) [Kineococcus radiotolerans SRS30216 = ATCC BAA-149]|uniref:Uncharacterized protein n=1 Tax=Kineococcus radiotolerans (strain ATCC BAA-149 / DSM 14245 / SRS30216) TaxID=266940 RepID=A6WH69_KINRD|nr:hypothetical protein Krad_4700 [Kineococcus radiotolerans SRS30216 = ATCC BAA-149]